MTYIALRNHTPYSLLEGTITIPTLLETALSHQMPAVGVADTGHLFSALEFSLACQKKGLHPLIGCQLSCVYEGDQDGHPLVLYAKTQEGYRNLCRLVTCSTVGQKPALRGHISQEQLSHHTEGLIALTGGPYGVIDQWLDRGRPEKARSALTFLNALFPGHLYLEISRLEALPDGEWIDPELSQKRLTTENQLIEWAYQDGLPLVATNPALFLTANDYEAQDALRCIALGRYIHEEERPRVSPHCYFRSPKEMKALFQDLPEALDNTFHVMKRCSFLLKTTPPALPHFPCARPEEEELRHQSQQGLERRLLTAVLPGVAPDQHERVRTFYQERLDYECDMIVRMGFSGYFLIVSDFIQWAKSQLIPVGPGRGSGASSLVAWSLSITDVDPLRFHLFFERFLNPERVTMPDFDVDFCQERRDEVIRYVRDTYGADRVAHIITFGTLQARAVLRDVGRVLQIPYPQIDKICKLIPNNPAHPLTLKEALQAEPQLQTMAQNEEQIQKLIDIGLKLEGLYRHASTHAAGVIISRTPLPDVLPLYQDEGSDLPATEFSMKYVESAGLVKFDFLGLKTLTVLQTAVELVSHKGITIDLSAIPLDDPETFRLFCRAETVGLFQLESAGMSDVLRQLQPEEFKEIIALVALYRPGPMDDIPRYLACRHGRESVTYAYDCLEDILKETFGVMIYQEQVLQIARTLAGYTLGGADLLRRAMGKKIKSEMDAQRKIFTQGVASTYGGDPEKASLLFDQIAKFAAYAFPKAHATPYALVSYQTAYLKANHPVEFMTALMVHDAHNTDKLRKFIREAKHMNIPIFPPDVNASFPLFTVESKGIRYGLAALKGVGIAVMEKIVQEREQRGKFVDIHDFMRRTQVCGINKKNLESLIAAGAFDQLHPGKRSQLMASTEQLLRTPALSDGPSLLFALPEAPIPLKDVPSWSSYESLEFERQAIGFYLTAHPLDGYIAAPFALCESIETMSFGKGQTVTMMGMVMDVIEKISKSGQKFAFLHLSDPTGSYEVTLFSDLLSQVRPLLVVGSALALTVSGRSTGDAMRLSAHKIIPLQDYSYQENLVLYLNQEEDLMRLQACLHPTEKGTTHITCHTILPEHPQMRVTFTLPSTYLIAPEKRNSVLELQTKNKITL